MINIPGNEVFLKIEPLNKGLSSDKKYYIETSDGRRLLLRVTDATEYERKKAEYDMLKRAAQLDISMSRPIAFGLCNDDKNVYQLLQWVDGEDIESVLPTLTESEQYVLGLKAGKLLRKIHSISAPEIIEDWAVRFDRKVRSWFDEYNSKTEVHSDLGEMIIRYLKENCDVLGARPQTFIHGDYNTENIIIMPNGEIGVIDFNSYNTAYGDPWWDINNVAWMPTLFPHFYSGQIYSYFNGDPPSEFWNIFLYYLAYEALAALTDPQGLNDLEDGMYVVRNILTWTDNLKKPIPTWYLKGVPND